MRILFLSALILLLFAGCAPSVALPKHERQCEHIYDLKSEICLTDAMLLKRLEPYKVLFVGDHHQSRKWHLEVAALITRLQDAGYRVHLASEWFTPQDDALLERYRNDDINASAFQDAVGWKENVGYPFASFEPMYDAVKKGGGSLYGINLSKEQRRLVSDANVSGMPEDLHRFYEALDLNVASHYALLSPFFEHCHHSRGKEDGTACSERMYRVQVAWDEKMAQESARIFEGIASDEHAKLIVFAGAFHLTSHLGIDMRFSRINTTPHMTILPQQKPPQRVDIGYADILYMYDSEDSNASSSASTL